MAEWFGFARTEWYHAQHTIDVPLKKPAEGVNVNKTVELSSLCKSITGPCWLNPLLFNGHLQTMWTAVKSQAAPVSYRRRIFESDDKLYPGSFTVDFVTNAPGERRPADEALHKGVSHYIDTEWESVAAGSLDDRPMLVVLHGLSGGSHELYLRHVLVQLVYGGEHSGRQQRESEWEACVINARGCANSKLTSGVLFNARATWDVRQLVKWLRATYPNRKLYCAGFSLGANILINYLGEEGEQSEIAAAVVCSNPWNLEAGSLALQRTFLGREVYSKTMGQNMKKLFYSHIDQTSNIKGIDLDEVNKARFLHEFDRAVQCPTWGWPTENAYYRDASSTEPLLSVRTPTFALHAEDDPVAPKEALPFEEIKHNPYAVLCTTSLGGHLSWFQTGGGRWYVHPVVNFLKRMAEDVDLDLLKSNLQKSAGNVNGHDGKPTFDPLRRKLHVAS